MRSTRGRWLGRGPAHRLALGRRNGVFGGGRWRRGVGRQLGFELGDQCLELGLVKQPELTVGDAIGTAAEALASQQLDVFEQLIDTPGLLLQGIGVLFQPQRLFGPLPFGLRQLIAQPANDPVEHRRVIRKRLKRSVHGLNDTAIPTLIRV